MGRMKELFTEYQQQMTGSNAEFIDDEYHFQKWVEDQIDNDGWTEEMEKRYWEEQCPDPFATSEELAQTENSGSIFPSDLFYDDEYYKSTYFPSIEEENENRLYSDIEASIIRWNIDGTKTAGSLTREILAIIKKK